MALKKKRPSAYISFSVQNRESVKTELAEKGNAKPGMGDIARLTSQRWNALGEEEKRAFKEKCEKEFEEKEAAEEEERTTTTMMMMMMMMMMTTRTRMGKS
jgi:hypothetical protein